MSITRINSLGITDGTIVNADINASAAIASTKLSGVTSGYTQGTALTPTGTTISFTGIPAGTKSIIITAQNLSHNGGGGANQDLYWRIGDAGGIETSGYSAIDTYRGSGGDTGFNSKTDNFMVAGGFSTSDVWSGNIHLQLISSNFWVMTGTAQDITEYIRWFVGHKELSDTLTQLEFRWSGGANFDNGTINIMYQ